ncbi:MAG: glycosyltransferase family 4 protein [Spirochaetales bacterium]|nr:glycosyltransferase family 4 protein [Spirochaetales bacterium]
MSNISSIKDRGIYTDLIRELHRRGNEVTVLTPIERKYGQKTRLTIDNGVNLIKVRTGNLFNVGIVEKLFSRAGLCFRYTKAIRKICNNTHFDLVLFTTPPTTLVPIVKKYKEAGAYIYLMLKDIFPQNAADLGMMKQNGLAFRFFRKGEREMYKVSDTIGCMSPANMEFIRKQDPWIDPYKIVLCPNSIEVEEKHISGSKTILERYDVPTNRLILLYGGGLGKPQGIDFLMNAIRSCQTDKDVFFLIVGSGVYFGRLKSLEQECKGSVKVIDWLPVEEYEQVVRSSDAGLVFLNHAFSIPNFPSRILNYMQEGLPIIAATDPNTDVGRIAQENGFGIWCESNDVEGFKNAVIAIKDKKAREEMGNKAFVYLKEHYSVRIVVDDILNKVKK